VADEGFQRAELRGRAVGQVARIAAIVSRNPGLRVSVQGYSDNADKDGLSQERADAVRRALIGSGLAANAVAAEGLGDGRPVASNSTAQGRRENTRVEIVVTGEAIGSLPLWDGIYPVSSLRRP
jgi:outer membrane protein OmpA-like peptidoglycan-associated protein